MIKTIIMSFGCDESGWNSCAIETHRTGFKRTRDALSSIGKALLNAHTDDMAPYRPKCCRGKNLNSRFCPECGTKSQTESVPVHKAVLNYYGSSVDECGSGWEYLDYEGWHAPEQWYQNNPFKDPSTVLVITRIAEYVIEDACNDIEYIDFSDEHIRMLDGSAVIW